VKRVGIVGASGLVGGLVLKALAESDEINVRSIGLTRIAADALIDDPIIAVDRWVSQYPADFDGILAALADIDVVVVAAGAARPDSNDFTALWGANALLPWIVGMAAARTQTRLVHVSSAAVLGNRAVLDESPTPAPFSPYSQTKAVGEQGLIQLAMVTALQPAIYRPTTVVHPARRVSHALVRAAAKWWLPLGAGDAPLPLAHPQNVAAVIRHLIRSSSPPPITIHPSEGMSLSALREAVGVRPFGPARSSKVFGLACVMGRGVATLTGNPGLARRIELLHSGQQTGDSSIEADGYEHPVGRLGWRSLVADVLGKAPPVAGVEGR
jgi:nucleoside-diphosphate-sugar epimerase